MPDDPGPATRGEDENGSVDLWEKIESDVLETFGEDADVTVYDASGHLDVRVIPESIKTAIEERDDEIEVVPYNAFRMTVRRDG